MTKDELYLKRCIELAEKSLGKVYPNPLVGAVIVHNDMIIGEGYHQVYGGPHAEVNAVNSVENLDLLKESTIYVSLEPCSHFGKTPPCADLLVKNKFKRVVIGTIDPYSEVSGNGVRKLKEAGIDVEIGILEKESQDLNKRFFTFHQQKRPYIILKWAQTQDGFIDRIRGNNEEAQINWITTPETKVLVHQWRTQEAGILVGKNTVINDNPRLTAREYSGNNPTRIVIDARLEIPSDAHVLNNEAPTIIINSSHKNQTVDTIEWIHLEDISAKGILQLLFERNIQSLIVEGGACTLNQFITENIWDEARVLIGQPTFVDGLKAPKITGEIVLQQSIGKDELLTYKNVQ